MNIELVELIDRLKATGLTTDAALELFVKSLDIVIDLIEVNDIS